MLFRPINVTLQLLWYGFGIRRLADRRGADALLMPANHAANRGRIPQLLP